jgi:hypothetical protein
MAQRASTEAQGDSLHLKGLHAAVGASASAAAEIMDPRVKALLLEQSIGPVEARQISDSQPHSRSLRALAARVDRREVVHVAPCRVIELVGDNQVPEWLVELNQQRCPDVGPRAAVTVSPDDFVRPSPVGTVPAW